MAMTVLVVSMARADGQQPAQAEPLDRVIAVVDQRVLLASDLDLEQKLTTLLPTQRGPAETPAAALQRLTTRALIVQQILREDPQGMDVTPEALAASLAELRQSMPACQQHDCKTTAGWTAYLASVGLTPAIVERYWSERMAVLRFIEMRFRSGVRIAPEEIEKYYKETLAPEYANPADVPPLDRLAPRISEILLQQRVNALLSDWLKTLEAQGQIDVIDPALQTATDASQGIHAKPASTAGKESTP